MSYRVCRIALEPTTSRPDQETPGRRGPHDALAMSGPSAAARLSKIVRVHHEVFRFIDLIRIHEWNVCTVGQSVSKTRVPPFRLQPQRAVLSLLYALYRYTTRPVDSDIVSRSSPSRSTRNDSKHIAILYYNVMDAN